MPLPRTLLALVLPLALLVAADNAAARQPPAPRGLDRLGHIVVLYMENWSFDGLFGRFPGADGIDRAGERVRQVDRAGQPYTVLPPPLLVDFGAGPQPDSSQFWTVKSSRSGL